MLTLVINTEIYDTIFSKFSSSHLINSTEIPFDILGELMADYVCVEKIGSLVWDFVDEQITHM